MQGLTRFGLYTISATSFIMFIVRIFGSDFSGSPEYIYLLAAAILSPFLWAFAFVMIIGSHIKNFYLLLAIFIVVATLAFNIVMPAFHFSAAQANLGGL